MFEPLDIQESSGVPVWLQIRNHLVFLIKSGRLRPGDVLPTVRHLAGELGVNYNTVHKVYQDLETDGLICSQRGRRSYVADIDRDDIAMPSSPIDAVIDELVSLARESGVTKGDLLMRVEEEFDRIDS
ncbi:MAG: GntR family transcriptional regulator [Eggerthellaceae bacterium]|nr:GntR family transcriptional regulator [Eggerthellaceae bacterium]